MSSWVAGLVVFGLLGGVQESSAAPQGARIATIRVHGNNVTPEDDILAMTGLSIGDPFTDDVLTAVQRRLVETGTFEGVDVLKRFASIADPTAIAVVIIVDEHPVSVRLPREPESTHPDAPPRVVRRRWPANAMWLPILEAEDGYGLTYGAMLAWPDVAGPRSRLAVPLSWGGERRAAVEVDRAFSGSGLSRLRAGADMTRRTNPAFETHDTRRRAWLRGERQLARALWAGGEAAVQAVHFGDIRDEVRSAGVDVTADTRLDPNLPRNAVYGRIGWQHYAVDGFGSFHATTIDARGYLGLVGQSIAVARASIDTSSAARPSYLKPLLGGWSSLRGFGAGSFVGDTRVLSSLELRVPVSSPLSIARTGISVFVDAGKSYDRGTRFSEAESHVGVGGGLWLSATVVQMGLSVARGLGSSTRVNVGIDLTF